MQLFPNLQTYVESMKSREVSPQRKERLQALIDFVQARVDADAPVVLQFICTHNSRRSQFAQIWAYAAAYIHGVAISSLSGGTEVTAFHPNAIASVKRSGFEVEPEAKHPSVHLLSISAEMEPLRVYSKRYDDPVNQQDDFAAVMTCSDADQNCPFIPGSAARIALNYEDPKVSDGTPQESATYDARQAQIASEMLYVFAQIR